MVNDLARDESRGSLVSKPFALRLHMTSQVGWILVTHVHDRAGTFRYRRSAYVRFLNTAANHVTGTPGYTVITS